MTSAINQPTEPQQRSQSIGGISNEYSTTEEKVKKTVRFHDIVKVVLVPDCKEYAEHSLSSVLWYNAKNYKQFKALFILELETKTTKFTALIKSTNYEIAIYDDMRTLHTKNSKTIPRTTNLDRLNKRLSSNQKNLKEVESKLAEIKAITKRTVRFHEMVKMVLVPDRKEYAERNLLSVLYWGAEDYKKFKATILTEVRDFADKENTAKDTSSAYKNYINHITA